MNHRILVPALLGAAVTCAGCQTEREDWNVVVILVDTLRADHLHTYGYDRATSPVIDRFAEEGAQFDRAAAQATWTLSSLASIMTSLYPFRHTLLHPGNRHPLPLETSTLAEVLGANGYDTAAFVANGIVIPETQLLQGFELFEEIKKIYSKQDRAELVNQEAIAWLKEPRERPFFLYLHYMDPHDPYQDPMEYHKLFDPDYAGDHRGDIQKVFVQMRDNCDWELPGRDLENTVARYDGEIRYVDEKIGEMLDVLADLGHRERTLIVILSDHGEQFLEHGGLKHATSVHGEETHVPLLIQYPGMMRRGIRIPDRVESIDMMPTILDLLDMKEVQAIDGRSLVPLMEGRTLEPKDQHAFTHHGWVRNDEGRVTKTRSLQMSLVRGDRKLIWFDDPRVELYDLAADPKETRDLSETHSDAAFELADAVELWRENAEREKIEGDPYTHGQIKSVMQSLIALGYMKDPNQNEKVAEAREEMKALFEAVAVYGASQGKLPEGLAEAQGFDPPDRTDPWGNAYGYEILADGAYRLVCYGEDGVTGGCGIDADFFHPDE